MACTVHHTFIAKRPFWYLLDRWQDADQAKAIQRANHYALDHGGYVCVKDRTGKVVYGTDPAALDRAIGLRINKHFSEPSIAELV